MKEWLRQHPDQVPEGLHPTSSTSHELRNAMKKLGWTVQETPNEVRMIIPGMSSDSLIEEVLGEADDEEESRDENADTAFALEYQLRDFLAQNLQAIPVEGHALKLFVDLAGRDGVEYPTAVGPIDILAKDETGAFVIFELKRARSPDYAIGQLARYMGWVKSTISGGCEVRGVILAKTISDKLRYAASVIPNVSLFEYKVKFELTSAMLYGKVN